MARHGHHVEGVVDAIGGGAKSGAGDEFRRSKDMLACRECGRGARGRVGMIVEDMAEEDSLVMRGRLANARGQTV
jgi:hypothetical protein